MADGAPKKRSHADVAKSKAPRPSKKQRKLLAYHSDSDDVEEGEDFQPVNLLDSDEEDLENVLVDDGASTGSESSSGSDMEAEEATPQPKKPKKPQSKPSATDAPDSASSSSEADDSDSDGGGNQMWRKNKSKRNDPEAFATSLTKILSTKLSTSRRADPVLARSAAAHEASRQALDATLEGKARRRMREQKRHALEKGRVRDVLIASAGAAGENAEGAGGSEGGQGEATTTAEILAGEKRLRRVAQRGVVRMFNAVRAAQVKAVEADRATRNQGVTGVKRREEKVSEMSRKGFLDLIASGGGGLKKSALEEA